MMAENNIVIAALWTVNHEANTHKRKLIIKNARKGHEFNDNYLTNLTILRREQDLTAKAMDLTDSIV